MTTNFTIVSSIVLTTPNYSWDTGVPMLSTDTTNATISIYDTEEPVAVTGYAPGVRVIFRNLSKPDSLFDVNKYTWNFGDYYNDQNNIIVFDTSTTAPVNCVPVEVEHTYVMPGEYTVSLTYTKSTIKRTIDPSANLCRGKYNIRWYWDDIACEKADNKTWDEVKCSGTYPKNWLSEFACLQKYCKLWDWTGLKSNGANGITWAETKTGSRYQKLWKFETNSTVCNIQDINVEATGEVVEQVYTKVGVVKVIEIPPIARMECLTRPVTGVSPYTVTISPKATQIGSFSIDRIDWDFNDGSPIQTVSRHAIPDLNLFTHTNTFSSDSNDPRNYSAVHTYVRNFDTYSIFYPSITCYATNTDTYDSCCIPIGPVTYTEFNELPKLLKVRNTLQGIMYSVDVDNTIAFLTTNNLTSATSVEIKTPSMPIRDAYGVSVYEPKTSGNVGTGYPYIPSIPTCPEVPIDLIE
jgi:hypothetical protein